MSEMVERVSEALRKEFPEGRGTMPASEDGNHDIGCYGDWARAAIAAMREPTPDMLAAAYKTIGIPERPLFANAWRTMIDEALNSEVVRR